MKQVEHTSPYGRLWYVEREGRVSPIDDPEVKQGFIDAIEKMYIPKQAT